jgi:phosphatidylserine synthase
MNKALLGAGAMVLTYLVFLLPLSRSGKNLLLGIICAAVALAMYGIARWKGPDSARQVAPVAILTTLILPFLVINHFMRFGVETLYILASYIFFYTIINILWAKKYG